MTRRQTPSPDKTPVALVSGASGGLGRAICYRLVRSGHHVVLGFGRSQVATEQLAQELQAVGGSVELLELPLTSGARVREALQELLGRRTVDVVVHAAGIAKDAAYPSLGQDAWDEVLAVNLSGFFHLTQPLIMPMVTQRFGRIIAISSLAGIRGNRGQVNYSASKAGLDGAVRSLALEVAKKGVTVNAVAPGFIETEMLDDAARASFKKSIPMQRLGRPEEVAALVDFLASRDAGYITGQVIEISGGL